MENELETGVVILESVQGLILSFGAMGSKQLQALHFLALRIPTKISKYFGVHAS